MGLMSDLPSFYRLAERSRKECRINGCDDCCVRGISICARHEYEFDQGDWAKGMVGWRAFLAAAGGDGQVCSACHGELVVPVGPPDEFGNVDFDDCDCVKP